MAAGSGFGFSIDAPAITRPGRCLGQVFIDRLTRAEAARWLGRSEGVGPHGATIAELYALRGDIDKVHEPEPRRHTGLYL